MIPVAFKQIGATPEADTIQYPARHCCDANLFLFEHTFVNILCLEREGSLHFNLWTIIYVRCHQHNVDFPKISFNFKLWIFKIERLPHANLSWKLCNHSGSFFLNPINEISHTFPSCKSTEQYIYCARHE